MQVNHCRTPGCANFGVPARLFTEFRYSTLKTWSRRRRVVGKAEWLPGRANPHFIVTSLSPGVIDRRDLYETFYCARGEMENRIKECQLDLFADRTSVLFGAQIGRRSALQHVDSLRFQGVIPTASTWDSCLLLVMPGLVPGISLNRFHPAERPHGCPEQVRA